MHLYSLFVVVCAAFFVTGAPRPEDGADKANEKIAEPTAEQPAKTKAADGAKEAKPKKSNPLALAAPGEDLLKLCKKEVVTPDTGMDAPSSAKMIACMETKKAADEKFAAIVMDDVKANFEKRVKRNEAFRKAMNELVPPCRKELSIGAGKLTQKDVKPLIECVKKAKLADKEKYAALKLKRLKKLLRKRISRRLRMELVKACLKELNIEKGAFKLDKIDTLMACVKEKKTADPKFAKVKEAKVKADVEKNLKAGRDAADSGAGGAKKEGAKTDGAKEEGAKTDGAKEEGAKEGAKEEGAKKEKTKAGGGEAADE